MTHLLLGEIEVEGRMPYSSNATFLVHVTHEGKSHPAIYKPMRGERPLWDFEPGLHRREVATYRMSEALGLHVVPPTVLRDGPVGEGSVQWFVAGDFTEHYFTMMESRVDLHDRFRALALLDIICNNTDRKSGHCILVPERNAATGRCCQPKCGASTTACVSRPSTNSAPSSGSLPTSQFPITLDRVEPPRRSSPARHRHTAERRRGRGNPGPCRLVLSSTAAFPTDPTGRRYPWPLV